MRALPGFGLLVLSLLLAGCDESDTLRIKRVGEKTLARVEAAAQSASQRFTLPKPAANEPIAGMSLAMRVQARLLWDQALAGCTIHVEWRDGQLVLTGTVKDAATHQRAVDLAQSTSGVEKVIDELRDGP